LTNKKFFAIIKIEKEEFKVGRQGPTKNKSLASQPPAPRKGGLRWREST